MSADSVHKNFNTSKETYLWEAVRHAHANTRYHRLGDDPDARRALKAWEAAFLGDAKPPTGVVIPFDRRRK
jgi:hypothetical protein